jgi:DNA replication and repair protein RecF
MDWGVFHVKHGFLDQWRRYQRALRQRNAALRQNQPRQALTGFEKELIDAGTAVGQLRKSYISSLQLLIDPIVSDLLELSVELRYSPGWPARQDLQQALDESWDRDCRQQATHPGPHRADLHIQVSGKGAKNRVSRGQQKLLAASLILAQCEHLQTTLDEMKKNPGVLLVDDPGAELDRDRLERLLNRVESSRAQLFVTALDELSLPVKKEAKRFHLELGKITEMVQ